MKNNRQIPPLLDSEKIAFANSDEKDVVATRGVKIKNKLAEKLIKEKKEREEYKANFEGKADNTIKYFEQQNNRAVQIIQKYIKISEDKTLSQNRGSIAADVEREIRQEIVQLALDLNNDEFEEDNGKGSVVVISAITKILLQYRDRINQLEFEIQQIKKFNEKLNSMSSFQSSQANNAKQ